MGCSGSRVTSKGMTRPTIFHLAIPCWDLGETRRFYETDLGCRMARSYPDRLTLDFFGDQLVCHLTAPSAQGELELYPRHFGRTFFDEPDYESFLARVGRLGVRFFREPFSRFSGLREEHRSFVIIDPSNNLLEFKYYLDPAMAY
jgi:uncharacterized protein